MSIFLRTKKQITKAFGDLTKIFGSKEEVPTFLSGDEVPKKLWEGVRWSYKQMDPYRQNMDHAVREYLGGWNAEGTAWRIRGGQARKPVPLNKIQEAVSLYIRLLASGRPQVRIETEFTDLRPYAHTFGLALNRHLQDIEIESVIRDAVLNSMFFVGVVKTGVARGEEKDHFEVDGERYDPGTIFSASIRPDNFVIDMTARSMREISYIGDRYRMPRAWAEELCRDNKRASGEVGAEGMKRPERSSGVDDDETSEHSFYAEIDCWDIYLPKQNLMCMFIEGDETPAYVYKWDGPEGGPYKVLGYDWVPGELLPVPPTSRLLPLHNFLNEITRKIERQASRQKSLIAVRRGSDEDAKTIRDASDGQVIALHDPSSAVPMMIGGADMGNHQVGMWADDTFDRLAGGIRVLSGTSPMTETATQDQMLHTSASEMINEMRRALIKFVRELSREHAWYLWTDPIRTISVNKVIEGTGISIPVKFSKEERKGKFIDYNFTINPYSLKDQTPEEKANKLLALWANVVMPNAEILMQSGYIPNVREFTRQVCELQGVPHEDMFMPMDPSMVEDSDGVEMRQPPRLRRFETVNTRISRSGTTDAGNRNQMLSAAAQTASGQGASSSGASVGSRG